MAHKDFEITNPKMDEDDDDIPDLLKVPPKHDLLEEIQR